MGAAVGGLVILLFFGLYIAGIVFWIVKLVEVARIPDYQFRAVGSEKVSWVLVVVLASFVGALIWQLAKRQEVLAAAGRPPLPPPGWYPEPPTGVLHWWDGSRWTGIRHLPPTSGPV